MIDIFNYQTLALFWLVITVLYFSIIKSTSFVSRKMPRLGKKGIQLDVLFFIVTNIVLIGVAL
jgi:hypothetical protein